jgi:hypothetical protein
MTSARPHPDWPLVVASGLGVNSTAMLVEFARRGIVPDMILFPGTGGEKPGTYRYLPFIQSYLKPGRSRGATFWSTSTTPRCSPAAGEYPPPLSLHSTPREVPVPEELLFDRILVSLFVPADVDEAAADAARAALDDPTFLDSVRRAVEAVLATVPALAVLTVTAEW